MPMGCGNTKQVEPAAPEPAPVAFREPRAADGRADGGDERKKPNASTDASHTDTNTITELEVKMAQADWGNAIKRISEVYLAGGDYIGAAGTAAAGAHTHTHPRTEEQGAAETAEAERAEKAAKVL